VDSFLKRIAAFLEIDPCAEPGGHKVKKRNLQSLLSLLLLVSTAIVPGAFPNKEESMTRGALQSDENVERIAMKRLDFVIGEWKGEGWLLAGLDQRYTFSVKESYRHRCGGEIIDGEGQFRPQGGPADLEAATMYGLGMIYFDRQSGEYRMWHYGGTGSGFAFTAKIEVKENGLCYLNIDAKGETYKFGFTVDKDGILTARSERQKHDGTWYVSMEFRMRKIESEREKER
jgi:hypothetical protein